MEVVNRDIKIKDLEFRCFPDEGVCRLDVAGEKAASPSLTDQQAVFLASMAMKLEEYYGSPRTLNGPRHPMGRFTFCSAARSSRW